MPNFYSNHNQSNWKEQDRKKKSRVKVSFLLSSTFQYLLNKMFVFTLIPKSATLRKTSKHSIDYGVYYLRPRGKLSCKRAVILFRPKGDGNTILKAKLMLPFENLNLQRTGKSVDFSFHIITAGNFGWKLCLTNCSYVWDEDYKWSPKLLQLIRCLEK